MGRGGAWALAPLALLLACCACLAQGARAAAGGQAVTVASLAREVDLTTQSLIVASVLKLENAGAAPLSSFTYCASEIIRGRDILWIEFDEGESGADNAGKTTKLSWTLDENECMAVELASPLTKKEGQRTVEIYEVFAMNFENVPAQIYQSEKQVVAFSDFDVVVRSPAHLAIAEQKTTLYLPSSNADHFTKVKPTKKAGAEIKYGPYAAGSEPEPSDANIVVVVEYPEALLSIEKVTREMTISSWSDIEVQEHYHLKNVGPSFKDGFSRVEYSRNPLRYVLDDFVLSVPPMAHSFFFIDVLGNITTAKLRYESDKVEVEAEPRFPIVPGWQTHFTFGYKLPKEGFVGDTAASGGKKFVIGALPALAVNVKNLTVNVAVPEFSTNLGGSSSFPFRRSKTAIGVKKWYMDIFSRPMWTLELQEVSAEAEVVVEVEWQEPAMLHLKEPAMVAAALTVLAFLALVYSASDFTLKGKVKTS